MRLVVLLLVLGSLLGCGAPARAQDQNRPFIKISHLGPDSQWPVYGLFITTQASALDDKLVLAPGYRAEPVFLVRPAEFEQLLELVQRTAAGNQPTPGPCHYGALKITLRADRLSQCFAIGGIDDSLIFISALADILDRYRGANRRDPGLGEAVRELRGRLSI
jgi:hypothetical protein